MRKKTLAYLLAIAMMAALSGCGKEEAAPEETAQTDEGTAVEESATEKNAAEETAPEKEADAGSGETEVPEEAAEDVADWMTASGTAVTPQGNFSLNCPVVVPQEDNSSLIVGKEDFAGSVEMTENIVGEHKEITVTLTMDTSAAESYYSGLDLAPYQYKGPQFAYFFFDRYTGEAIYCLTFEPNAVVVEEDGIQGNKIWGEGGANEQAAFYFPMKSEIQDTCYVMEQTLYCPADYDGAVFGVCGWPQEPGESIAFLGQTFENREMPTETLKTLKDVTKGQRASITEVRWFKALFGLDDGGNFKIGESGADVQKLLGENCRLFTVTNE